MTSRFNQDGHYSNVEYARADDGYGNPQVVKVTLSHSIPDDILAIAQESGAIRVTQDGEQIWPT